MVAALLKVHDDVEQRHLVATSAGVEGLKVTRQDELVVLPVGPHSRGRAGYTALVYVHSANGTRTPHKIKSLKYATRVSISNNSHDSSEYSFLTFHVKLILGYMSNISHRENLTEEDDLT